MIAFIRFGGPQFDPHHSHNIFFHLLFSFSFKARRLWDQFHGAHSFSLNILTYSKGCGLNPHFPHLVFSFILLLTLSSIQEVVGSIPTLHIYISPLFFSYLSHLVMRLWVQSTLSTFIFPIIFLMKYLCSLKLGRSQVQSPMTSHFFKKLEYSSFFISLVETTKFQQAGNFVSINQFFSHPHIDFFCILSDIQSPTLNLFEQHVFNIFIHAKQNILRHKFKAANILNLQNTHAQNIQVSTLFRSIILIPYMISGYTFNT